MKPLVDVVALRESLAKQLEVVGYNQREYVKRLYGNCQYQEVADWSGRLYRSEQEADRLDTLIRECEWGYRMPPHP